MHRWGFVARVATVLLVIVAPLDALGLHPPCDEAAFQAARQAVEEKASCPVSGRKRYLGKAKRAVPKTLVGACRKQFVKLYVNQSTCGRRRKFEVCCSGDGNGI